MTEPIVLKQHPRAARHVRLAKGWGGLTCFVLAALLASRAGVPLADALLRGVAAGVVGTVACWAAAIAVWRHLALAEVEVHRRRLIAEQAEPVDAEPVAEVAAA